MERYEGNSNTDRVAVGKVFFYDNRESSVRRTHVADTQRERRRFDAARRDAIGQLERIYRKAVEEVGEDNAAVFDVHKMMLEDKAYLESVYRAIEEEKVNAEYAVAEARDTFTDMFEQMDDDYMRARADDIRDVSERLIAALGGEGVDLGHLDAPVVLVADDLMPSETVQMDKEKILAFVTRRGSPHSHTAILAKVMDIPSVFGVDIREEWEGRTMVVDGCAGTVTVDPDGDCLAAAAAKTREGEDRQEGLHTLVGKETVTKSGRHIELCANIGSAEDMTSVLENDAEGIGLFRSECLFLESDHLPTEEEQFLAYRAVAERMNGKKVVIRTLDIGADKVTDYFDLDPEDNPAMGYRAIRICLDRPEMFRSHLRAILRAGACGSISVMFPMIISVDEVLQCRKMLAEAEAELEAEGIACHVDKIGIMVETPAAVWISGELAREADFFSIGTNDLTQYILAIDRENGNLESIYDSRHPAVMRAIRTVVENGHRGGTRVAICGELAADVELTREFVDMGVDELSVPPSMILPVRDAIRKTP